MEMANIITLLFIHMHPNSCDILQNILLHELETQIEEKVLNFSSFSHNAVVMATYETFLSIQREY